MKSSLFLFRNTPKVWFIVFFLLLIAMGCQDGCTCSGCNGCTTSVVVDQEALKKKVDGVDIKIIANKNRVTNRKLRIWEEITIDKTIWYSIDYYLRVENRPEVKNICEYEVEKTDDLKKALVDFTVKFSPDKKHFAVGLKNHVYDFFHLLDNGVPFSSGCYYLKDSADIFISTANVDFKNINWKVFPSPDQLFDKIIVPNTHGVWSLQCNKDNVLKLLDEMPAGNPHEMVLIENWFCEIADLHFTEARVAEIIKVSPVWKKTALKKLIQGVENTVSENDLQLGESLNMIKWINDSRTLNTADSLVFDEYFAAGYAGDYLIERMQNKNIPLNKNIHSALLAKAKGLSADIEDYSEKMTAENAFDILIICKENELLKAFMKKNISVEILTKHFTDVSAVTIRKFEMYPKDLQTQMIGAYLEIAKKADAGLSNFDINEMLEFLKNKISCGELKKLVELHKDKLVGFILPDGC